MRWLLTLALLALVALPTVNGENKTFLLTGSADKDSTFKLGDKLVVNRMGDENKSDLKFGIKELQGKWRAVEMQTCGNPAPKEVLEKARLEIKNDEWIWLSGGPVDRKSRIRLDPSKSPKEIDITMLDGQAKGSTFPGIYALEKGQLLVCYSHTKDPKERPKEFKTARGQLRELLVLERVLADDAEDKTAHEAEKLFRDLEQMVRAAKTLQIRFDAIITGANSKKADDEKKVDAKKWHYKGSAILGEGDKFRAEYEGNLFGQENKRTFVSDGTHWTQFGYTKGPKPSAFSGTEKTPKAIGAYLRPALPRDGFVLCFVIDRRSQLAPDHFIVADFKLAGEEKIGERNTQVIQYTVKAKAKDPSFGTPNVNLTTMKLPMKMWLDTKTKLPVKLAMMAGDSQWNTITETYSEFSVDAKVDAKLFELPKDVLLPGPSAGGAELKGQTKPPKSQFTVRCLNKNSVLFPETQGELNLKVECLVVVEKEIQLKPGDFRLALLDAKLQQLDEISMAIPADWKTKTFKKGANKDTLTMNFQGGDVVAGREYYLAIMISTRGTDNVFPVAVRFVKFKVSNVGPGRTDDEPQRVPPPIKQPMPEMKELPKGVVAAENEAEKLFRDLEQKVRTAKTLQIRFHAVITGPEVANTDDKKKVDAKKWHFKGSTTLGEGDKFRAEYEGNLFGQENKHTLVSDGSVWTSFGHTQRPGEAKVGFRGTGTESTPKAIGAYLRPALPRDGFVLCFITDRRNQLAPDHFIVADFKLAGEEKIGERNTHVIQYTVKTKAKDPSFGTPNVNLTTMKLPMKMWLDTKTKLPVKLAMMAGDSQWNTITETYSEFSVDAMVDAKLFELPKVELPGLNAGCDEAGQKDQEKIQGTWELSSLSIGGQVTRLQPKDLPTRIFTGTKLVTKDPGKDEQETTFKLDAGKKPKYIDMTDKAGKTL